MGDMLWFKGWIVAEYFKCFGNISRHEYIDVFFGIVLVEVEAAIV